MRRSGLSPGAGGERVGSMEWRSSTPYWRGYESSEPVSASNPARVSPNPARVSPSPARVSPSPARISPSPARISPSPARISPSPARISRLQEMQQLRALNDRLAACIGHSCGLETERRELRRRLAHSAEREGTRSLLEQQLADWRGQREAAAAERARIQLELGSVREENRLLRDRTAAKKSELESALTLLRDRELALNYNKTQLTTSLGEKRHLESELLEVQAQLANANAIVHDTKTQLQDEMLRRCELENKTQALQVQLDFQKSLHEKEMTEVKRKHEVRREETEIVRQVENERQLSEVLQKLRGDQSEQIKQYREQLERSFHTKLETALLSAAKDSDFASAAKEEAAEAKVRTQSLVSELQHCRRQISELKASVQDREMVLDRERATWQQRMVAKEEVIGEIRKKAQEKLEEYEQLLDVKLALDLEINAYRKMLEGEEQRLDLTPRSLVQSVVALPSHVSTPCGKKRKLFETEIAAYNYEKREHTHSKAKVILDEIDNEGKFVKLRNISNKDQPLKGWIIRRKFKDLTQIVYRFPAHFTLKAKQNVTIWAANHDGASSSSVDLVCKEQRSWGSGDVRLVLLNATGVEMSTWTAVQMPGTLDGKSRDEGSDGPVEGTSGLEYSATISMLE
ncbi:lamin-L(III)-like isoform X2 [Leucoraja erinacea]|uniref:lamin-L(III)-like isoform X2 n=1 Tax=Leucoraja erinaceus TaxID=7782 RepID=UPI002456ECEC|nr:lamin-L(III)-like isoform X2 [Leucoraja erinacea]